MLMIKNHAVITIFSMKFRSVDVIYYLGKESIMSSAVTAYIFPNISFVKIFIY